MTNFFDTLSDKEIRRRQSLCSQQLERAFAQRNDKAMAELRKMDNDLMEAMLRRC